MRVPAPWVRRPLSVGLVALATWPAVTTPWPLAVVGAGLLCRVLPGRWRPVRLLAFLVVGVLLEAAAVLAWAALTLAYAGRLRGDASQGAHLAVLRTVLQALVGAARLLFGLRLSTDAVSWSPLDDGTPGSTNAMVVLCRHAGPGDSLLLVHTLLGRDHLRRPRVVLKQALALDPVVDLYLSRLPSAFLRPDDGPEVVGRLARGLGQRDALLLFPEGGNVTPERRVRALASLRRRGMAARAARAERLAHLLPPRPGGVLAALEAAPHADVVLVGHTGLEHLDSVADVWRALPLDGTLVLRWWFVPAADVPVGAQARTDWLDERWAELDAWVTSRSPCARGPARPRPASPDPPTPHPTGG